MTLKQTRLLNAIPTSKTLAEAKRKAGYSELSRIPYLKLTKLNIAKKLGELGYDKESMKQRFELGSAIALKLKDVSNYHRGNENICKLQRFFDSGSVGDVDARQFTINFINNTPDNTSPAQVVDVKPSKKLNK